LVVELYTIVVYTVSISIVHPIVSLKLL